MSAPHHSRRPSWKAATGLSTALTRVIVCISVSLNLASYRQLQCHTDRRGHGSLSRAVHQASEEGAPQRCIGLAVLIQLRPEGVSSL
jgi:hypothetical protein